jgi:betaine-homocysteine S-methyltransferase
MVSFTYYAHREKLRTIGREDDLEPLNRQAHALAREVAQEGDALVAGSISNTWAFDPGEPERSGEIVRAMYREQVSWAAEGGVDLVIAETNDYLGEALIGLDVIKEFDLPAVVTFASTSEATIDGHDLTEACKRLEDAGAEVVGLNCSRGPATMLPLLERIRAAVSCQVAAQPVAYHTTSEQPTFQSLRGPNGERAFPIALDPFTATRYEMADFAVAARDLDVRYVGVCCGGAPHHVRSMAEALGRTVPASRYSPAIELHPILGEGVAEKEQARFGDWRD